MNAFCIRSIQHSMQNKENEKINDQIVKSTAASKDNNNETNSSSSDGRPNLSIQSHKYNFSVNFSLNPNQSKLILLKEKKFFFGD